MKNYTADVRFFIGELDSFDPEGNLSNIARGEVIGDFENSDVVLVKSRQVQISLPVAALAYMTLTSTVADPVITSVGPTGAIGPTGATGPTGVAGLHAITHEDGGSDEINVAGLSGVLADPQTPSDHDHTAAGEGGVLTNDEHDGYVQLAEISEPDAGPAAVVRIYAVDQNGFTRVEAKGADGQPRDVTRDSTLVAKCKEAAGVTKGQAVYISGASGSNEEFKLARSDAEETMPAIGLVLDSVADNAFARIFFAGKVGGIDTSSFSEEGVPVYVDPATAGLLIETPPTLPDRIQRVGIITRKHASQGEILVNPPGQQITQISHTVLSDIGSNSHAVIDTALTKLGGIEDNATADQTNAEIETAYNAQVALVTQAAAEAGVETIRRGWTAERVKQAITVNVPNIIAVTKILPTASGSWAIGNNSATPKQRGLIETLTIAQTAFRIPSITPHGKHIEQDTAAIIDTDASYTHGIPTLTGNQKWIYTEKMGVVQTTGVRAFIGWANLPAVNMLSADDVAGAQLVGFQVRDLDATWFAVEKNVTMVRTDTTVARDGLPKIFVIISNGGGATPYNWLILNSLTQAVLASGNFTTSVIPATTGMYYTGGIRTLTTSLRQAHRFYMNIEVT